MYYTRTSAELHPINGFGSTSQWFDYTPQMNAILNALHKRIFNWEIALQTNSPRFDRSQSIIDDDLLSRPRNTMITEQKISSTLVRNSMDTLSQRSTDHSSISGQYQFDSTLEKQLLKLNLSPHVSFDLSPHSGRSKPIPSQSPISYPPNQMKIIAYEFATIFEDVFDELNIIYHTAFSIDDPNRNNNQSESNTITSLSPNSDCSTLVLNLAGIVTINEQTKFRSEMNYLFQLLIILFRALLFRSPTEFQTSVNNIHNHLPSVQLNELNHRLQLSEDRIKKLSFIKKNFHTEKSEYLNILNSTKFQLKDRLMEEKYRSKIALRYSTDWKNNHISQWIEMLSQSEEKYTLTIHQYETALQQTGIVHHEIIKILSEQNNITKINANRWYEYYQNETSRFEKELINFRHEFNEIKRQRQDMYEEYQRMKIIVDDYHQMKMNEKLFLEKQKQEEEAIKRIQAWWRGTMFRHIKLKPRKKKKKKK